jgi:putative SOS response-associated peptidase YedK
MTTSANELVGEIHDRMPVILSPDDYDLWLDPEMQEPAKLTRLYKPFAASEMESYLVSTEVNKVANQGPELIEPIASQGGLF